MNPTVAFNSDDNDNDHLPAGQQARAEEARLNPNDPARHAEAGTPVYGEFGKPENVDAAQKPGRDGSNDNPDEFSELRKPEDAQDAPANPQDQRGHVEQNQDPHAVRSTQNAETDEQRAAWSDDDPRYAGGHATPTWQNENDKEHSNN